MISKREDVYRVVRAFASRGEWIDAEVKQYTLCLVRAYYIILISHMLGF